MAVGYRVTPNLSFSQGQIFQNLSFTEGHIWPEPRGAEVGYFKTEEGLEVDFLVRYPAGAEELVQVCADTSDEAILGRELALTAARKEHRRAARRILSLDRDTVPRVETPGVESQPAYEWLLGASGEE